MSQGYFVTGTDTNVGKTVACGWIMLHSGATYWKPVQSGLGEPTDTQFLKDLTGLPDARFLPPVYELSEPLSPHEAAKRDGIKIDMNKLTLPRSAKPLIVEGAGGLMVPLNKDKMVIDLMAQLGLPVVLVARSGLGTINHTLLSLEALRRKKFDVVGVILNGPRQPHNRQAIEEYGQVRVIAEIPQMEPLDRQKLLEIEPEPGFGILKSAA